ncbi:hypothetical protein GQ85_37005 [Rhodococcus rhodochrous]|nr:hypothetical protein GQ85_37005 [Rhodococcus rhodochrous]
MSRVSCRERSLTSTAVTSASGDRSASVRAIGPQPAPTSRNRPVAGGAGTAENRAAVPLSRPSGEKIPLAVWTSTSRPARRVRTVRRRSGAEGSASK